MPPKKNKKNGLTGGLSALDCFVGRLALFSPHFDWIWLDLIGFDWIWLDLMGFLLLLFEIALLIVIMAIIMARVTVIVIVFDWCRGGTRRNALLDLTLPTRRAWNAGTVDEIHTQGDSTDIPRIQTGTSYLASWRLATISISCVIKLNCVRVWCLVSCNAKRMSGFSRFNSAYLLISEKKWLR